MSLDIKSKGAHRRLVAGLTGNFSLAAEPTTVMRQSITYVLVPWLLVGLAFGLLIGLAVGPDGGLSV